VEALAATGKGGWIVAGRTTTGSVGGYDGRATLLGANGAKVWDYTYGGTNDDEFYAVETLADGTFALAGRTKTASIGGWDGWLVRVSADGVWMGESRFGGSEHDELVAVAVAANGDVVLAGGTGSSGAGLYDGWVVRADKAGAVVWKHSYGTVGTDVILDIVALPDGDFVVGGRWSDGTFGKCWIARLDGAGRTKWNWLSPGTQGLTHITRVQSQPDGTIAAVGTLGDAATVFRVDGAGRNATWAKMEANSPQPHHAWATADGGWWVAGSSETFAVVRTDAWGHFGCASAGKCAGLSHRSCQDQNPCTTGTCEPAKGCVQAQNTDPCDAGATCTAEDKCSGGMCQAGLPKLFSQVKGSAGNELFYSVQTTFDGRLVGCGIYGSASPWLVKWDAAGTTVGAVPLPSGAGAATGCYSSAEFADGRLALAIFRFDGTGALYVVDRNLSQVGTVPVTLNGAGTRIHRVKAVDNDELVLLGYAADLGVVVLRTDDSGKPLWSKKMGGKGDWAYGLATLPSGEFWVGMALGGTPHVARLGKDGNAKCKSNCSAASRDSSGRSPPSQTTVRWWPESRAQLAPAPRLPAASTRPATCCGRGRASHSTTPAGIALAGHTQAGASDQSRDGWLGALDAGGHLVWERKVGGDQGEVLFGLAALPSGGLVAVGYTTPASEDGWIIRTDAWGQLPCAVSGPCAKADFTSCDDGDGCTLDVCLPLGGCKHDPVQCGGGKVCKAGVCGL